MHRFAFADFIICTRAMREPISAARVSEILVTFITLSTITVIFVARLGNFP